MSCKPVTIVTLLVLVTTLLPRATRGNSSEDDGCADVFERSACWYAPGCRWLVGEERCVCRGQSLPLLAYAFDNNFSPLKPDESEFDSLACEMKEIGGNTGRMAEASDARRNRDLIVDGEDGDVDFPFGDLKPLLTIGEYDRKTGYVPVGVPDGQGAYLRDKDTVRLVFQGEGVGPPGRHQPSWFLPVNGGAAKFSGSHVSYVDYNRRGLANFMTSSQPASSFMKGAGTMLETVINLAGDMVGPPGPQSGAPHYGDTSASGVFVSDTDMTEAWAFHALCSAHLEQPHQWGRDLGFEDTIFLTNEEGTQTDYRKTLEHGFVGLTAHALDVANKAMYAVGIFGGGGFEKWVEINCGVPGYVCIALSGYNGQFADGEQALLERRQKLGTGRRSDGTEWRYPKNIVPARIYIGAKSFEVNGRRCWKRCSFLARNGLAYGKVYGFAVPEGTDDRDAYHVGKTRADVAGQPVEGFFAPTGWRWDGVVKDFETDIAWQFQEPPKNLNGYKFWTAAGRDEAGFKTEHLSPDPRGNARFVQGSTAGYIGFYDMTGGSSEADHSSLAKALAGLQPGALPKLIPAKYFLHEGTVKVSDRIELGGKGLISEPGYDQTRNYERGDLRQGVDTFQDVDGMEWLAAAGGRDFLIIQEDSSSKFGERMFISEIPAGPKELPTYYFIAQSGGSKNTRSKEGVCVPAGTSMGDASHEFSGATDLSGVLTQPWLGGAARRAAEAKVDINDKIISVGLQAHSCRGGVVGAFGSDRGGQIYAYKPNLPRRKVSDT